MLSRWAQCDHKSPYEGKRQVAETEAAGVRTEAGVISCCLEGSQETEREPLLEAGKSKETDSSWERMCVLLSR